MKWFSPRNTLLLSVKELLSLRSDPVMLVLIGFAFTVFILVPSRSAPMETVHASVAVVFEDRSPLSNRLYDALLPPQFKHPARLDPGELDRTLPRGLHYARLHLA